MIDVRAMKMFLVTRAFAAIFAWCLSMFTTGLLAIEVGTGPIQGGCRWFLVTIFLVLLTTTLGFTALLLMSVVDYLASRKR